MKLYEEGYELKENEYMLKIRKNEGSGTDTGFMAKMNQNGSFPIKFKEWPRRENLPIYVIEETFRGGWKLEGMRFGKSQNWAVLTHPFGFSVEVHADNGYFGFSFVDLLLKNDLIKGELIGSYKWEPTKLIKDDDGE